MSPSNRRPRSPGRDGRLTLLAVTSFRAAGAIRSPALGPARVSEILDRAGQIAREAEVRYSGEVDPATPPAEVVSEWGSRYDLLALGAPATSWLTGPFSAGVGDTALGALPIPCFPAARSRWSQRRSRGRGASPKAL